MGTAEKLQPEEVSTMALTIIEQGKSVVIKTSEDYEQAGFVFTTIKSVMKQVDESFDPIIQKAHQAHKEAVAQKKKIYEPLENVSKHVKRVMSDYDAEQERIRKAEESRLQEIARKEEEERKLAEAIAAEQSGDKQEAEAIINEEIYVAPVVVKKEVPKVQGMSFRTIWKFRIIDEKKIPREYLTPDSVKIGGVVRSLKKATNIPGVQVYEERV
jgi:DNA repair ATPase RecN